MDAERRKAIHEAMVRLSDGDRTAFDILLDELWPVIHSFAERGIGKGPDAEDIAQEVFFKICSRIADFDRNRDAVSWAFGIASYEIMTLRRRKLRRRELHDESSLLAEVDSSASQEEVLISQEMALAFQHVVGTLSEDERRAFALTLATRDGPVNATLRKRKQRTLERLRRLWSKVYGES
ncbi:MAG: RNA polymerase sigma factor [Myxococcota bacterium]